MKIANANLMKEINLNHVRQVMKRIETATKPQLAALTRLSVVTINSLIKELLERGEIAEHQTVPSSGGRPALTYRYNYNYSHALAIYLKEQAGQRLATAIVINLENRVLAKEEHILPSFDRQYFQAMIQGLLEIYPEIKVIGFGIPGQIVGGTIIVSSHQELQGAAFINEMELHFGLPVIVENDVNAAVIGYTSRMDAPAAPDGVAGIYFPRRYPPGMGIYLNGSIVKGKYGLAGEIKFLPLNVDWYADMEEEAFLQAACQVIQSVSAVLAPDTILIYQNKIGTEHWNMYWDKYQAGQSLPYYPEVILLSTFQEDYETGMCKLILHHIDPVPAL